MKCTVRLDLTEVSDLADLADLALEVAPEGAKEIRFGSKPVCDRGVTLPDGLGGVMGFCFF